MFADLGHFNYVAIQVLVIVRCFSSYMQTFLSYIVVTSNENS